ncbi:hypothetical protein V6N11_057828 [Hibiscus sabdariffa]|uniref:Uncharacterized protein n=2 Tax=Hibiscus sabdariffa TaxID=183260 RepID=A0ABR2P4G5_9ROSI
MCRNKTTYGLLTLSSKEQISGSFNFGAKPAVPSKASHNLMIQHQPQIRWLLVQTTCRKQLGVVLSPSVPLEETFMPTGDPMVLAEEPTIPSQSTVLAPSSPHEPGQAVNDQIVEPVQAELHISPPTDSVAPEEVDAVMAAETNTPSSTMMKGDATKHQLESDLMNQQPSGMRNHNQE